MHSGSIVYLQQHTSQDKNFEMELAWVTEETGRKFQRVPKDLAAAVLKKGKETVCICETII